MNIKDDMNGFFAHYGHWGLVSIMIVLVSWILYRFVAPRSWREWAGAGLVQAFIIALYAEMYGFPLTIYLLTGFFDYVSRMDLTDARTVMAQLPAAFEHFNEVHPHSALKMKSPREFRQQQAARPRQAQPEPAALYCEQTVS